MQQSYSVIASSEKCSKVSMTRKPS